MNTAARKLGSTKRIKKPVRTYLANVLRYEKDSKFTARFGSFRACPCETAFQTTLRPVPTWRRTWLCRCCRSRSCPWCAGRRRPWHHLRTSNAAVQGPGGLNWGKRTHKPTALSSAWVKRSTLPFVRGVQGQVRMCSMSKRRSTLANLRDRYAAPWSVITHETLTPKVL